MTSATVPRPRDPGGAATPAFAVVLVEDVRRVLPLNEELTVGRGRTCDVRIAHEPPDDHISRVALALRTLDDCVLVRNESASKPLALRPLVGTERVVEPREAATSLPHRQFSVVLTGRFGTEYAVHVDVRGTAAPLAAPSVDPVGAVTASTGALALTPAQRRLLTALCEPLLVRAGPRASPATYRQIGERVGRRPGYVRNVLKQLREQLAGQGVPALVAYSMQPGHEDFRPALAMWALHSRTITAADLGELDAGRP